MRHGLISWLFFSTRGILVAFGSFKAVAHGGWKMFGIFFFDMLYVHSGVKDYITRKTNKHTTQRMVCSGIVCEVAPCRQIILFGAGLSENE